MGDRDEQIFVGAGARQEEGDAPGVALEEQRPLDHEPHRFRIPVPQVGTHGAAGVEVRGDRKRAVPMRARAPPGNGSP